MALIGEALISASVQVLCDRITSAEFVDLFRHKKLDKPLLMKLNTTLLTLNVVLDDAEEKQMVNPAVRKWLDELKHAVFDAEDLLDEIDTEALRRKLEGEDQIDKLTNKDGIPSLGVLFILQHFFTCDFQRRVYHCI
ncbi:hypothetical protein CerSpe_070180 [Prunus speciosa]